THADRPARRGHGMMLLKPYPELRHVQRNVLVERELDRLAYALVTPRPVHQQQLPEEPELRNRHVGAASRLQTLHAADAHADVRRLDHGYVVRPVADGEEDRVLLVLLHQLDNQRLLQGRYSAAD